MEFRRRMIMILSFSQCSKFHVCSLEYHSRKWLQVNKTSGSTFCLCLSWLDFYSQVYLFFSPTQMDIQTFIFPKRLGFTKYSSKKWLQNFNAKTDVDDKPASLRYRQHDPDLYVTGSFRTLRIENSGGVRAVFGRRKKNEDLRTSASFLTWILPTGLRTSEHLRFLVLLHQPSVRVHLQNVSCISEQWQAFGQVVSFRHP